MRLRDGVPISDARARLTEVVGGVEKILTKRGSGVVVDARKLNCCSMFEEEHTGLVLLGEAEVGLHQLLTGRRVSVRDLMLAVAE